MFLVVAATAENYDNSKDDDPGAVIIEKMAQAVVIHKICSSEVCLRFFTAHLHLMREEIFCDTISLWGYPYRQRGGAFREK